METTCTTNQMITIPTDLSEVPENSMIDMSNLKFDIDDSKKKYFSFIYIRNSGIKVELNFNQCSYEDKEEFLMLYMTSGIEVKSKILASTWLEILFNHDQTVLDSFLTVDEIKKFNQDHSDYITTLRQFINALPLFAMDRFQGDDNVFCFCDFEMSDFTDISLCNFYQLTEFENFVLLLGNTNIEHKPLFFEKIFNNRENLYYLSTMLDNLPYIKFLEVLLGPPEMQNDFLNTLNTLIKEADPDGVH